MNVSPESIPSSIIDFAATAQTTGSETFALELADMFLDDLPKTRKELADAVSARNVEQLRAICHRFAGGTAYFIAPQLIEKLSNFHNFLRNDPDNQTAWLQAYNELVVAMDTLSDVCNGR